MRSAATEKPSLAMAKRSDAKNGNGSALRGNGIAVLGAATDGPRIVQQCKGNAQRSHAMEGRSCVLLRAAMEEHGAVRNSNGME